MPYPDPASPSCPHMAALPTDRARRRPGIVAERLERLERIGRPYGAPAVTLAATQGARVLLETAKRSPEPRSEP